MARDWRALEAVADGTATGCVRLYGFSPACLSLGRLQSDTEVNWSACERDGIDVVRRPTGGRAVLHDQEVTYAVACRNDDPNFGGDVLTSCARIHVVIAAALQTLGVRTRPVARAADERAEARRRLGIPDCFASPASHELVDAQGLKLVGSAQARQGGALLQHGSILLEPPRAWMYTFNAANAAELVPGASTRGVRDLSEREVSWDELTEALIGAFAEALESRLAR